MTDNERIVAACDALKRLSDHLAGALANQLIEAETPTHQLLGRQGVFVVRQVHGIAILLGWMFYAEQAGQLIRGLAELTRIVLWLDVPDDPVERRERALTFWNDGIRQTRSKYDYQQQNGRTILAREWKLIEQQEQLIAEQEAEYGVTAGSLPDARAMWESLGRPDLYGLFRWESDPAHGSAVSLGTVVASNTPDHFDLGGPNMPKDRARRLGAALILLQLSGETIVRVLNRDLDAWKAASQAAGAEMTALLSPILNIQEEE